MAQTIPRAMPFRVRTVEVLVVVTVDCGWVAVTVTGGGSKMLVTTERMLDTGRVGSVTGKMLVATETMLDTGKVAAPPQAPRRSMRLVSSVTAAVIAKRPPPPTETPVVAVMEAKAMTLPSKIVAVPRVAELPTCQKTLQGRAPLMRMTEDAVAVVRVEPNWKTKTAFGSP